ncbi:hypothetical protein [Mesorhizobium sp. M1405]|uniref:hypothetical protein n=1 Tax=Mesorhizobium sp. M1405 TaxID=2957098 RepID=UPI00333C5229
MAFDLVMRLGRTIATVERAEAVPNWEAEGGEGKPAPQAEGDLDLFALLDHKFATQGLKEKTKSDYARDLAKSSKAAGSQSSAPIDMEIAIAADPQADRKPEYNRVQAAKLVHKMASGTYRRWESGPWSAGTSRLSTLPWTCPAAHRQRY